MKRVLKFVFWIVVFTAVAYGAYLVYARWWKNAVAVSAETIRAKSHETISGTISAASEEAADYTKKLASDVLSSAGNKLNSFAAYITGEKLNDAEKPQENNSSRMNTSSGVSATVEINPVVSGPEYFVPPPFAAIVAVVNEPIAFSINNKGFSYSVDWGDGKVSEGIVPESGTDLISHKWDKKGDYAMTIEVRESGEQKYFYSLSIRIYE